MEVLFRLLILRFVCCGSCIYSIQHTPIDVFLFEGLFRPFIVFSRLLIFMTGTY